MTISIETLKAERELLKDRLRQLEVEQRKVESELKAVRQLELRAKREIEALTTLIELSDSETKTDAP